MNGAQGRYRKECQGQSLEGSGGLTAAAAPMDATGILVGIDTDDQRCLPPTIISSFTGARGKNILCLCPPGIHLPPRAGGRRSLLSCNKGLTLIEIAVVMVLIGILVGLGATMVGPVTKRVKVNKTIDSLNTMKETIVGFAVTNRRLPTNSEVATLANLTDAWGKGVLYLHPQTTPPAGSLGKELTAQNGICANSTTGMTVCTDATCSGTNLVNDVAFVLVSGSESPLGGYNIQSGIITAAPCTSGRCVRILPAATGSIDDYTIAPDVTRSEAYDDITTYVTLNELKGKVGCTKYDTCAASGITINNNGTTVYYRRNNGASCTAWTGGTSINLATTDSCQVFTDGACTSLCTTGTNSFSYGQLKDLDIDNDCSVQMNTGCLLVDR